MRKLAVPPEVERSHLGTRLPGLEEVREFAWGRVLAGAWEGSLVVIVQEWWDRAERCTFYECSTLAEQEREVARVRRFGRGAGASLASFGKADDMKRAEARYRGRRAALVAEHDENARRNRRSP